MAGATALSSVGSTLRWSSSSKLSRSPVFCSEFSLPCSAAFPALLPSSRLGIRSHGAPKRLSSRQRRSCLAYDLPFVKMSRLDHIGATVVPAAAQGSAAADTAQDEDVSLKPAGSLLSMTYLEGNSWLWEILGTKILVDPVLVGNLDFGIPLFYDGAKFAYKNFQLKDLPEIDYLLICQAYDDHCHEKTLNPLSELQPNIPVIATPNAQKKLSKYFKKVSYLDPTNGESTTIKAKNGTDIVIRASPGPVLGPPWQRPENGYFVEVKDPKFTIYHEPHCVFDKANLDRERADVLVTPVVKQTLPGYTLVSGQEDAVKVADFLQPEFVVTMANGELDAKGLLSMFVRTSGTTADFKELLAKRVPQAKVLEPKPGVPLEVPIEPKS